MFFKFPNADDRLASVVVSLSSESSALLVTLNSVCALGDKKHFNDLLKCALGDKKHFNDLLKFI